MTFSALHGSFWHDDKLRHLAELMGVRPAEAAGWMAQLWAAAVIKAPHGDLSKLRIAEVARWAWASEGAGAPDAERLVRAMVEARLLDEPEPGTLLIHDWELPTHLRDAQRKKQARDREREERLKQRGATTQEPPYVPPALQKRRPGRVQCTSSGPDLIRPDLIRPDLSNIAPRSTEHLPAQPTLPSVCAELAPSGDSTPEEPALVTFPAQGAEKQWHLTAKVVAVLSTAYPQVDVLAEARKALAWVLASPERRKTARGYRRFLTAWVSRAVNSGTAATPRGAAKTAGAGLPPPTHDAAHCACERCRAWRRSKASSASPGALMGTGSPNEVALAPNRLERPPEA